MLLDRDAAVRIEDQVMTYINRKEFTPSPLRK